MTTGTGGFQSKVGTRAFPNPTPSGTREHLDVSVVLPCLDEVESVGQCVSEARAALESSALSGEVLVVDNGCTDDSAAVAAAAGAKVVTEARPGYGHAIRAGIRAARGDVVVMADADFTYDLRQLPTLVEPVRSGHADMVVGSRLRAARTTMPVLHRLVGTPALSFLISRACGARVVSDSQSGFRAFRRDRVQELGLQSAGMELASEMLVRAAQAGLCISETPVAYRERIGSSKLDTFSDGWRHLRLILLLAPTLLLIGPGAVVLALGAVLSALTLIHPAGVHIGSLRWQPVFLSSTCVVLGLQGMLAGAVLANRSSVGGGARRPYAFVVRAVFLERCLLTGIASITASLAIDLVLFVGWVRGRPSPPIHGLPVASLAQSLLMVGGTLTSFAVIARLLVSDSDDADDRSARSG